MRHFERLPTVSNMRPMAHDNDNVRNGATMNKKQTSLYQQYKTARHESVNACYGKCSSAKQSAERAIIEEMHDLNGYGYKVTSYNTNFFSCAYVYADDNGELHLVHHSKSHRYDFAIDAA